MTSAVDPHDFSTMEITIGPPNNRRRSVGHGHSQRPDAVVRLHAASRETPSLI